MGALRYTGMTSGRRDTCFVVHISGGESSTGPPCTPDSVLSLYSVMLGRVQTRAYLYLVLYRVLVDRGGLAAAGRLIYSVKSEHPKRTRLG